jgi:hypothetical protein
VHIPLRLPEILVARELLNGSHGRSTHREMRTERVPKDVDTWLHVRAPGASPQHPLDHLLRERSSLSVTQHSRSSQMMALAVNATFHYPQYFVMIPTGPQPHLTLSEGFFEIAARQNPRPETVAILIADAPFSQSPSQGRQGESCTARHACYLRGQVPLVDDRLHALNRRSARCVRVELLGHAAERLEQVPAVGTCRDRQRMNAGVVISGRCLARAR